MGGRIEAGSPGNSWYHGLISWFFGCIGRCACDSYCTNCSSCKAWFNAHSPTTGFEHYPKLAIFSCNLEFLSGCDSAGQACRFTAASTIWQLHKKSKSILSKNVAAYTQFVSMHYYMFASSRTEKSVNFSKILHNSTILIKETQLVSNVMHPKTVETELQLRPCSWKPYVFLTFWWQTYILKKWILL